MFEGVTAVDVSSTIGLIAMVLLTLNILMGLLVSVNYNTVRQWPHRKLPAPLHNIHSLTGYVALAVTMLHPTVLMFSATARFRVIDVLWPFASPGQTGYNILGAVAFYALLLVILTSYWRKRLGHVWWKRLHFAAYFAAASMYAHGILIDPKLTDQPPDLIDGEKVLVEGCLLIVAAAMIWRWRYGSEKQRYKAALARQT